MPVRAGHNWPDQMRPLPAAEGVRAGGWPVSRCHSRAVWHEADISGSDSVGFSLSLGHHRDPRLHQILSWLTNVQGRNP